jgi:hypothetical protein
MVGVEPVVFVKKRDEEPVHKVNQGAVNSVATEASSPGVEGKSERVHRMPRLIGQELSDTLVILRAVSHDKVLKERISLRLDTLDGSHRMR